MRRRGKPVPVRVDVHLMGGVAKPWFFCDDLFPVEYIFDFDGKVLVDKKRVKHRIPRKYRKMVGDEIYVGHMLIPNTFIFAGNRAESAVSFYVDWNPIGLNLFKRPRQKTHSSPVSL